MPEKDKLLRSLRENFDGTPWHGHSLRTIVESVDAASAHDHPLSGKRSIAELLAHTIAWIEIVERRLRGDVFDITPSMDFPDVANTSWPELVDRMHSAHKHLLEIVGAFDDSALSRTVAGKPYTVDYMLNGLMHHNSYHAAQIALLRKR